MTTRARTPRGLPAWSVTDGSHALDAGAAAVDRAGVDRDEPRQTSAPDRLEEACARSHRERAAQGDRDPSEGASTAPGVLDRDRRAGRLDRQVDRRGGSQLRDPASLPAVEGDRGQVRVRPERVQLLAAAAEERAAQRQTDDLVAAREATVRDGRGQRPAGRNPRRAHGQTDVVGGGRRGRKPEGGNDREQRDPAHA